MFGEVIGEVVCASVLMYDTLSLGNTVLDPVEMHVHGFGVEFFERVIEDSSSTGIVGLNGSGGEWSGITGVEAKTRHLFQLWWWKRGQIS